MGPCQPFCQPFDFKSARNERVARRRRRHFDFILSCVCPPRVIRQCASKETAVNSCSVSDLAPYTLLICDFQQKMEDFDDDLDYELSQLDLSEYNQKCNTLSNCVLQVFDVDLHETISIARTKNHHRWQILSDSEDDQIPILPPSRNTEV
ncbi:unnamed protein product [Parnassius apollo]|uniref:(apollo) hypothetical protein n=1 Tax=Parnassius apollo TaxID=110799 RepID=A0A8S3X1K2_PARAO|nr:unnamed protein product [Parnassius apollo]